MENLLKNHKSYEVKKVVLYTFGIQRVPVVELTSRLAVSVSGTTGHHVLYHTLRYLKNKKQGNVNNWQAT